MKLGEPLFYSLNPDDSLQMALKCDLQPALKYRMHALAQQLVLNSPLLRRLEMFL